MGHNLTKGPKPLGVMASWQGPNVIILSRSPEPPIARLDRRMARDSVASGSTGIGKKGEIRGKSLKSCLNLGRLLASLDWDALGKCLHLSLTYHLDWPRDKEALQQAKQALVMSLSRHVEAGLWMLEYQKRMAPHFHLLVWLNGRDVDEFAEWLCAWWSGLSGNSSEYAVRITYGDQARSAWYLAMHSAKRSQSPDIYVGRWWGYIARKKLLGAQDLHRTGELVERDRVWWARLYRRATGARTRNAQGLSWFLPRNAQYRVTAWIQARVADELRDRTRGKNPF